MDIPQLLDQLYDAQSQLDVIRQSQLDVIRLRFNELQDSLISPEIKEKLDEIKEEEKTALETCQEGIDRLTETIKTEVIKGGETVKGKGLMAVWNKRRSSWDTKRLEGYAGAHPEIRNFRKEGDPSITIRRI